MPEQSHTSYCKPIYFQQRFLRLHLLPSRRSSLLPKSIRIRVHRGMQNPARRLPTTQPSPTTAPPTPPASLSTTSSTPTPRWCLVQCKHNPLPHLTPTTSLAMSAFNQTLLQVSWLTTSIPIPATTPA